MDQITTAYAHDDFTVTMEPTDVGWVVTATDNDTYETVLLQYTAADKAEAQVLFDNMLGASKADMR